MNKGETEAPDAQLIYEENKVAFKRDPSLWLDLVSEIWRKEHANEEKIAGKLLALVNHDYDIFTLAINAINKENSDTFNILHVVGASFPYLDEVNLDGLVKLCITQYQHTKNDMMSGMLYNDLEPILIGNSDHCIFLHEKIRREPREEIQGLYQVAMYSLVKSNPEQGIQLLCEDATSSEALLQRFAVWAIGLLLSRSQVPSSHIQETEKIILNNISNEDESIQNTAIQVSAKCLMVTNAFDKSLERLAIDSSQTTLCAIAEKLFISFKEIKDDKNFEKWARLLCQIVPEYRGGVDNFDYVLGYLIEDPSKRNLAVELLTSWVIQHGQSTRRGSILVVKLFDSTVHAIFKYPELISQVITDWYLMDDIQLAVAATDILGEISLMKIKAVSFDSTRLDSLGQDELIFLARRMLGYISSEDHLFSLVNSLLDTENAKVRTFPIVKGLFVNELGEDYPSSIVDFLEDEEKSEPDSDKQALYVDIIQTIKGRMSELDSLPRLLELQPNPDLERKFASARAKQMSIAMAEANKGSIVEMIATKIPIKAGLGTFSHRDGGYSDPSYLQSFSTSISIPRRTVIDEVGLEIQAYMMRDVKKGEE